ncbi:FAD:protein FMN transferase [Glaciecola siphonariae]|uniref:FAD:protein FMN transferase n=1 Tax=Glaciecola siphonariae TaxID=521012 RepID=A0ABV9LYL6_9ALTE
MRQPSKYISGVFIILTLLFISSCSEPLDHAYALNGKTMGTTYNVKFYLSEQSQNVDVQALQAELDQRLIEINQLMSTYIPDSELSLLNQAIANEPFPISDETQRVINEALRIGNMSNGALDITVGPLVNLWGFGPDQKPETVPRPEQISELEPFVGTDKFVLDGGKIIKAHHKVYIDLSTIAKGYAVDELASILSDKGIADYLVEIGGEMRVAGKKPGQQDWLVAIEKPITSERAIQRILSIGDNAIASSGDYRNYFEEAGVRFSHLIDPKTAYPIQHNLVAVSVIAPTCIEADGLATALIVMGAEEGRALAERAGISALFITKEGDEFVEYRSTAFERHVKVVQ